MRHIDQTAPLKKRATSFVTINGEEYYVEDWLYEDKPHAIRPLVIVSAFEDAGQRFVVIRDEKFERKPIPMSEFVQMVKSKKWIRIDKPKYNVGQRLKNRFTERYVQIIEVPFAPNDKDREYTYFVLEYSPVYGKNFTAINEKGLDDFYKQEGVELR